jgi:hypothetical protein
MPTQSGGSGPNSSQQAGPNRPVDSAGRLVLGGL